MGEKKFLIDTNVIFHFAANSFNKETRIKIGDILNENPVASIITYIELLSKDDILKRFADNIFMHEIDENIVLKTIELRRKHKIKLPDAIVAATALVHNLNLLTHNTKDFKNIKGLTIVDPFVL